MLKLIPKGWYPVTITQAYFIEKNKAKFLNICFTVNGGEYAYRHIIRQYPLNQFGLGKLENHFLEMEYYPFLDVKSPLFLKQFVGKRALAHVDRHKDGDVISNLILELKITKGEPEFDVTRPKKEDHYHENNKGRELPICENKQGTIKTKQFDS